jgi:CheY-like chemotaxis protein
MSTNDGCTIVLVEDNDIDRFIVKQYLRKLDNPCEMIEFEMPFEAVNFLNSVHTSNRPGLIIVDLNMPQMSGHDVIRAIRSLSKFEDTPVAVLTSSASPVDIDMAMENGADSFTTKPLTVEKLGNILALMEA